MREADLKYITDVLQDRPNEGKDVDWYSVLGFLKLNRIGGYFYGKVRKDGISVPVSIIKLLSALADSQERRNRMMGERIKEISIALEVTGISYAVLKGGFLSHSNFSQESIFCGPFYGAGERISNDIDILISPRDIGKAEDALVSLGYIQGYYDAQRKKVRETSRREILDRRMNRGETVPYQLITGDALLPHIEVDINFSLDYLPTGTEEILESMLNGTRLYASDCGEIRSLEQTDFLIHLILHQYKEMRLYWMVERGKDLELYKLLDIYLLLRKIDRKTLMTRVIRYGIENQANVVLKCVQEVFESAEIFDCADVIPRESIPAERVLELGRKNREYEWTIGVRERLLYFNHTTFLKEVREVRQ